MLIDCPGMTQYRSSCGIGPFIVAYRTFNPHLSAVKLYALYMNDSRPDTMKKKSLDLYHMKFGWHKLMNILL